jgi:parallel beta-helix repeat protein
VGGTITGLTGAGLQLFLNNTETLAISGDGSFTFATAIPSGGGYAVTVKTQPVGQYCTVTGGIGTVNGAVTSIVVTCGSGLPGGYYTIGGTVSGLVGTGLKLQLNGAATLDVTGNGVFTFTTPLADSSPYTVTVLTNPATPAQTCTVSDGAGTVSGASVTDVNVTCSPPASYLIGGTVTGLTGSGLQLLLNGTATLSIAADGPFQFSAYPVVDAGTYTVTVQTQPSSPGQTCVVTYGSGTVNGADVNTVMVTCNPPGTYTVGGTLSGLATGNSITLRNNGADDLTLSANGAFTFPTALANLAGYSVTVQTPPSTPAQTCVIEDGSGTIAGADITSVAVNCLPPGTFSVGGTVAGYTGSGLTLRLNGSVDVEIEGDGPYTFPSGVTDGGAYSVTVQVQPTSPNQYCAVSNASGTIAGADVTNVDVACSAGFTVGGTLNGLLGGNTITLHNNGGDDLVLSADGAFAFATPVGVLQTYNVTIAASPASPPQQCSVSNGSGIVTIGNVTSVAVNCSSSPAFTVGGSVSGLSGSGLVLHNNGGDALPIAADGGFTFVTPLFDGSSYDVTVGTPPSTPSQTCTVTDGSGTVSGANVTSVSVSCATNLYTIGGTVSGLTGTVTLQNNGGDSLPLSGDGAFTFGTPLPDLSAYSVTVSSQPAGQFCTVSNGSGALAGANVTTVGVVCNTLYTIGGTVSGLSGSGLVLRNNGADDLPIAADGGFTFASSVPNGGAYAVTVATQPGTPNQTCTVTGGGNGDGSGTVSGASVTDILVTCVTNTYTIGGTVAGMIGSGLVLRNNGGDTLLINGNGAFTFATALPDLSAYNVTKMADPSDPLQVCTVSNGSGVLAGANVTTVQVDCPVNPPTVAVQPQSLGAKPGFTSFTLDFSGVFTDAEDPPANLVLSVESVNPAGVVDAAFDSGTQNLRLTYVYSGWYDGPPVTITVKATDSTLATATTSFPLVLVPARYENGVDWNEYVVNDGPDGYNASDTACTGAETGGYSACIHGGEARSMPVPGYSACTGLTASDALDAFFWTCNQRGGQAYMETRALKPGRGLADLIDWSGTPAWLENALTVYDGGTPVYTSPSRQWWGNPVQEIGAAATSGVLNSAGKVYAVTARPTAGVNYTLGADGVALVVKPGFVLQGSGTGGSLVTATSVDFLWVEGSFSGAPPSGTANSNGLAWTTVGFSVARKVKVWNGVGTNTAGINISAGGNNRLSEILVANQGAATSSRGIWLRGGTAHNTLADVTVFNNAGSGIEIQGSSNNRLFHVVSFANGAAGCTTCRGIYLPNNGTINSNSNVLANVTVTNNLGEGVYIVGQNTGNLATGNTLLNITAANNTYGLRLLRTNNTYVGNLAAVTHSSRDVLINTASNNTFDGVLKVTNTTGGTTGCSVTGGTNPGLTNTTCTATGAYGSTTPGGAVLHKVITVPNTFLDAVLSDTLNASEDANGEAAYAVGNDWSTFENAFRGWGLNDAAAFPATAQRGRCATGTCQLWDWSLALGDLGDLGPNGAVGGGDDVPVLLDAVTPPTGNDAVTHNWAGGGSVTLLLNAVEQRDAATGDNDGLCESGETCLYTPNIGAYQGHGALQSAGSIGSGGTVENIQLVEYAGNGY